MQTLKINWQEPLNLAHKIICNYEQDFVFLYSALNKTITHSKSYIALFPKKTIATDDFSKAKKILETSKKQFFGYISYETASQFEDLKLSQKKYINTTLIHLANFSLVFEFCHDNQTLIANFDDKNILEKVLNFKKNKIDFNNFFTKEIKSNFSDKSYLEAVEKIKKMIKKGDFYQTNLTRKFFGKFDKKPNIKNCFFLFKELCKKSPANFAGFLKLQENFIISSSPELFLTSENNNIYSRPIKGTIAKSENPQKDKINISYLQNSPKEKAENLMIVDLVRNDLSRICKAGSVKVKNLFNISSYTKLHHMSSEIHGCLDDKYNILDSISACFPPGSMTGAPKIQAIKIANKLEKMQRGIYSGTIGMFSYNKINCSVVIRTIIIQNNKFEFQVGGAITYDSIAQKELEETFVKAKAIIELLKINNTLKI